MKQERIDELLKAARKRLNAPPGGRTIGIHPEEIIEMLEGTLKIESSAGTTPSPPVAPIPRGVPWDAVGRIAAAYIARQPPHIGASSVVDYVENIIQGIVYKEDDS